jgi:hypothetical protein
MVNQIVEYPVINQGPLTSEVHELTHPCLPSTPLQIKTKSIWQPYLPRTASVISFLPSFRPVAAADIGLVLLDRDLRVVIIVVTYSRFRLRNKAAAAGIFGNPAIAPAVMPTRADKPQGAT